MLLSAGRATAMGVGGAIVLAGDLPSGSATRSLLMATNAGGSATISTHYLPLDAAAGKHLVLNFSFAATMCEGGLVTLANLGFDPAESTQAAVSGGRVTRGNLDTQVDAGGHKLSISISVDSSGQAVEFICSIDGTSAEGGTPINPGSNSLGTSFGPRSSVTIATLALDDVVLYVAP